MSGWRVWQDTKIAHGFTERRRGGLLGSEAQIETMLRLISYVEAPQLSVLDLGCGDGILLQSIMSGFPVSHAVALDGSPAMLEKAETRFEGLGLFSDLVEFVEADFNESEWTDRLPVAAFDVIVSGFAIHHSEDEGKGTIYRQVFQLLNPGGVFVNIEHVASLSSIGEEMFETAYAEQLAKWRRSNGEEVTPEQVYVELQMRPDKAANRLASVEEQLGWLRELGFVNVDCYWKHYELAVFAGFKPAGGDA